MSSCLAGGSQARPQAWQKYVDRVSRGSLALLCYMLQDLKELLAQREQRIVNCLANTETARASKDFLLAAHNFRAAEEESLMVAMLQWRSGLANPTAALQRVVEVAQRARPVLQELMPPQLSSLWLAFNYEIPVYADAILSCAVSREMIECCCPWSRWQDARKLQRRFNVPPDRFLDAGVLQAMQVRTRPEGWDEFLEDVQARVKVNLLTETYRTYMNLILEGGKEGQGRTLALVDQAAKNFTARAKNKYYAGGPGIFGGDFYNGLLVDFSLASLIRCCLPDRGASLTGDAAIHVWRW
jgi:hypothetical protein